MRDTLTVGSPGQAGVIRIGDGGSPSSDYGTFSFASNLWTLSDGLSVPTLTTSGNATIGGQALVDTLKNPLTAVVVDDSLTVTGHTSAQTISGTAVLVGELTTSGESSGNKVRMTNTTPGTGNTWNLDSYNDGYLYVNWTGAAFNSLIFDPTGPATFTSSIIFGGNLLPSATGKDIGTSATPVDTVYTEDASVSGFANFTGTNTGTATCGAGDSIQVTLTGFTSSGIVVVTYLSNTAMTVLEIPLAVGNRQTDKFTIFGSNGEQVLYWVARK